jgi:hypothetical protein
MNNLRVCLPAFLVLVLIFQTACKKKGGSSPPDGPEVPVQPVSPSNPGSEMKMLTPQSISTDRLKVEFVYMTNENRLTEIRQSNGTREMINYNDRGVPKEYKRFLKDELIYHVYYLSEEDGLVTKANQYTVASGGKALTPIGNYQIKYGTQKQIETVEWYDFKNMLMQSEHNTYDNNLLLTERKSTELTTQTFEYDEHPGIFKHVPQLQLFSIEHQAFYMLNQKTNVKSIRNENHAAEDVKFEMQYNIDGYPSTITQIDATGTRKTFKISYR